MQPGLVDDWIRHHVEDRDGSDPLLANVAAGPLEDLLCRSPDRFIDRVEQQALRDPKFARCLTAVWGWSSLSRPVQERIARCIATVKDSL